MGKLKLTKFKFRISLKRIAAISFILLMVASLLVVIYATRKTITVVINGKPQKIITYKSTLGKALETNKIYIGSKDKVEPKLDSKIKDKDVVNIKRALNVKVSVDDKKIDILSSEDNVGKLLEFEGITLNPGDKVSPGKDTSLSEGLDIQVIMVETKGLVASSPIDFDTVVKTDSGMPNTQKKVAQEGIKGEKQTLTSVTYENGKEVSRWVVSETVIKKPVNKIVVQGSYPLMPISRGGDVLPYSRVFRARATAYSAIHGIGTTYTASGRRAVRDPNGYSTIAVDPRVIPLGTRIFVEGYGFAIAADTGTAIIGNTIDVFFDTYQESVNWAVKYVNVYILN